MIDLKAANHTNRELELMLDGRKPLAVFYAGTEELPNEDLVPEKHFESYVVQGKFIREEAVFDFGQSSQPVN